MVRLFIARGTCNTCGASVSLTQTYRCQEGQTTEEDARLVLHYIHGHEEKHCFKGDIWIQSMNVDPGTGLPVRRLKQHVAYTQSRKTSIFYNSNFP